MKKILTAFAKYPRDGHSPQILTGICNSKGILNVRGNVYERLSGRLDNATRFNYISSLDSISKLMKNSNMDISCILKELKNV